MMHELEGRRIVLGITGGVAAYKAAVLCRELVRRGAFVSPVMTAGAERFIGAPTLSAVASEPVRTSLWDSPEPSPHTDLGQAADLVVVAPATAHLLAAARAGLSEDLLTTTLLATRAPVLLCPAMHTEMWEHAATRDNVAVLQSRGVHFVMPDAGELAGGDVGAGRLADPIDIADACAALLGAVDPAAVPRERDLTGTTVLVSAGGTREALDPVRYIGNRSSGKQGHAVALAAAARGARVQLVTAAEVGADLAAAGIAVTRVTSAEEMLAAMQERAGASDLVVMCAAVADFRPVHCSGHKLKRRDGLPVIELESTPNILETLVAGRTLGQTIVGFAAETDDMASNAREKLAGSGADLVVANDVSRPDAGFECDTNAVTIYRSSSSSPIVVDVADKRAVADRVLDAALEERAARDERPRLREVR
ncbi:MAG: phosphopantothenoylcysteine decarboxylase/phosphopantothenate--cysteine ligase [Thermoleophilia bacterium]|nr:phosphopantothenoylcysteine decarboxylase/phosphopantothenate--cysteine ligase [Thermoleophilia bacterium]